MICSMAVVFCLLTPPVAQVAWADPVLIENVPKVGWRAGQFNLPISALTAALQAMGCEATYEELMVASGAAFSTVWEAGHSSGAVLAAAPEDFVLNGAAAVGAKAERRALNTEEEMLTALRESIDEQRPIVAWYGAGACVVCGYDTGGPMVYIQHQNNAKDEYQHTILGSLFARRPERGAGDPVFLHFDPGAPAPERDWPAILKRAITYADWDPDRKLDGALTCGLAAYDDWAETLRTGGGAEGPGRAYVTNTTLAAMMRDARTAAATVLAADTATHDAFATAALHYRAEANVFTELQEHLPAGRAPKGGPEQAVWDQAAGIVEKAKAEEVEAVDALRRALGDLAPPPSAPVVAEQPSGSPAELCARARELKAAKQYAEAAKALEAALVQDPEHIEAHWILAWVRVELGDKDGAAAAFRKVIELSPGTDRANEAQKALDRMDR
jgi:hypothetical protein